MLAKASPFGQERPLQVDYLAMSGVLGTGHRYRWFLRLWPLAAIFHLAGNEHAINPGAGALND